jgi:hypothetical protein
MALCQKSCARLLVAIWEKGRSFCQLKVYSSLFYVYLRQKIEIKPDGVTKNADIFDQKRPHSSYNFEPLFNVYIPGNPGNQLGW